MSGLTIQIVHIDANGDIECFDCVCPSPTPSVTASVTRTPSRTPSISFTRTPTPSSSKPSSYPYNIITHITYSTNLGACDSTETPDITVYFSTQTPVIGNYVYTNSSLTNYFQGDDNWYQINNGTKFAVQILSDGMIFDVLNCGSVSPTPSLSRTPTRTPSISISRTPSRTPSLSISRTPTRTPGVSPSRTPTRTPSGVPTYRYTVDMYYCEFPYCSYSLGMAVIENTYQISIGSFFVYDSNTIMEIMNSTTSTPDYYTNFQNYLGYDNCNTACQNSQ
jgi:hypothetical protein